MNSTPLCEKKGHYKAIRNIVCISNECPKRGLICVYCLSSDHISHKFMGVDQFIEQVQAHRSEGKRNINKAHHLREQLGSRYRDLQLKISDLANNLEILTHQVKVKCEKELDLIEKQVTELQEKQDKFIFSQGFNSCEKENSLKHTNDYEDFVQQTMEFVNYTYQDGEQRIQVADFTRSLYKLNTFEIRLDQIQDSIQSCMSTVCQAQEELGSESLKQLFEVDTVNLVLCKTIENAHQHKISNFVLINSYVLISSSFDGFIKRWNLKTMECERVLRSQSSMMFLAMTYIQQLNILVALTNDNFLHVINSNTLKVIKKINIPSSYTNCPLIVKVPGVDEQVAVSAGSKIFIIDIFKGNIISVDTNGYYVQSFDIWSDGNYKYLLFGDKSGKMHAYEMKTKTEMPAVNQAHEDKIIQVKVLGKSSYIITASFDKQIKVWKMPAFQYIGGWESKGQVEGIASVQDFLVVKEKDSQKLHVIFVDSKGSCKKKPYVKVPQPSEGAFIVSDLNRAVISSSYKDRSDQYQYSGINIQYF